MAFRKRGVAYGAAGGIINRMPSRWTAEDASHMAGALELAARGRGRVEPNPMVGCVLVKGGRVIARGFHRRFGGPHAEAEALRAAGRAAAGATAYVTLEPCAHFGKTPPCADALIAAGVRRVVAAMADPNPLVAGQGLRRLRRAGLRVETGLMRAEAEALNRPFVTFHRLWRPYVILKWGQSIDGKIATRGGESKWITSRESRRAAHRLRARVDAVIVGVGTVLADDPDLTARHARPLRRAARVILDRRLRTPPGARVVRSARRVPTLIACAPGSRSAETAKRRRRLEAAGCEVVEVKSGRSGILPGALLSLLRSRGMTNVMVEGGSRVLGSFFDAGLVDEAVVFVAPRVIGGAGAPGALGGRGPARMGEVTEARRVSLRASGPDLCYNVGFW
jgi:diaminohydroxyphosphoribosylaminopyrimidine deaminase/5-amino-6-(5-phosphoribosylamino)uracil reductase